MKHKKTLVVGASTNVDRYSNKAIKLLRKHHLETLAFGLKAGEVEDVTIKTKFPKSSEDIHTVTMYVGPKNQAEIMDDIIRLNPERVIFNPGTENEEFYEMLQQAQIKYEEACTLVLLNTGQY
jgi:uncharacterized protein